MSIRGQSFSSGASGAFVTVGVGDAANLFAGAYTVMVLARQTTVNVGYFGGWATIPGGTERGGLLLSDGILFGKDDFSSGYNVGTATDGEYRWLGYSKPAGAAHYRMHAADLASLTWSHGESSGAANHGDLGASAAFTLGMYVYALGFETADIAAVAVWVGELSDSEIEVACTQAAADLAAASPTAGWLLPEAEVGTAGSIVDFTGGGADETARQDVVASTDPADFDFSLTPPGVDVPVGQATETDIARPIGKAKARAVGRAVTAATAQPFGKAKARAVGRATTVTVARPIGAAKTRTVGQATETCSAQSIVPSKARLIGRATETDTARRITPPTPVVIYPAARRVAVDLAPARVGAALTPARVAVALGD